MWRCFWIGALIGSALVAACGSGSNGAVGGVQGEPSPEGGVANTSSTTDASSSNDSGDSGSSSNHDAATGDEESSTGPSGDASLDGLPPPPGGFPGQAGNPVGYEAAPGYPGSLTKWTGGNVLASSGTAGSPVVYNFQDFVAGSAGTLISGSHLKFVGCRFQSNDVENYNVEVTGSDITFEYSSVTPLVTLATAPPHEAWPSAGAGEQLTGNGTGYQINGNDGYEYGLNLLNGPVTLDHCDIWGFGNAVTFMSTTAQMTIQNCWIHDAADAAAQGYHTDGPGYLNNGAAPQNVSILNNTIASIGNTNGIALQTVSSPYGNITMSGNYLSGFGYTADVGHETVGSTHMTFTNNVLGTDLPWIFGPIYGNTTTLYSQATNTWSGNTLKVLAGTSPVSGSQWQWSAQDNGQYLWPDTTTHTTDF
jgi:hypothetical protein